MFEVIQKISQLKLSYQSFGLSGTALKILRLKTVILEKKVLIVPQHQSCGS
jgi:hypothetical protein